MIQAAQRAAFVLLLNMLFYKALNIGVFCCVIATVNIFLAALGTRFLSTGVEMSRKSYKQIPAIVEEKTNCEIKKTKTMKRKFLSAALLLGITLTASAPSFAQVKTKVSNNESKLKVEDGDYELKIKQDRNEFKLKEEGNLPLRNVTVAQPEITTTTTLRQGETMTTVKAGKLPETAKVTQTAAPKKAYTAKKCNCPSTAARKTTAKKSTVAYKAKPKAKTSNVAKTTASPIIVHDTVFVTRVDTVLTVMEQQSFAGYRHDNIGLMDNFKELKIKREDNGEVKLKKEYDDGRDIKRTFSNEDEFRTYMEWKNF
jgi:hypothetical protein